MDNIIKIRAVKNPAEAKYKEKSSLFVGRAFPISNKSEAEDILDNLRKKYYDATHHCYAYKIYPNEEKYSDDGEPNGTAGIRILNALNHFGLENSLLIVTRYFGGVKLGVGPLGKAYYESAVRVLEKAAFYELTEYIQTTINFDYNYISQVHKTLNDFKAKEIENLYDPAPKIRCKIISAEFEKFKAEIKNTTNGSAGITENEKKTFLISR